MDYPITYLPLSTIQIREQLDAHFPSYTTDELLANSLRLLREGHAPAVVELHLAIYFKEQAPGMVRRGALAQNIVARVLLPRLEGRAA